MWYERRSALEKVWVVGVTVYSSSRRFDDVLRFGVKGYVGRLLNTRCRVVHFRSLDGLRTFLSTGAISVLFLSVVMGSAGSVS